MVLKHQTATLLVAVATLVLTILLYVIVPKGFFPVQDTGVIQGISEARAEYFVRRHGETAAGAGAGDSARPGGGKSVVLHRGRTALTRHSTADAF